MEKKMRGRPKKISGIEAELPTESRTSSIMDEIDNAKFDFDDSLATPEVKQFNPLGDAVVERGYATPSIAEGVVGDLEEPSFHKESFQEIVQKNNPQPQMGGGGQPQMVGGEQMGGSAPMNNGGIPNPLSTQDFDDKERRESAEQLAEAMVDGYEMLNKVGHQYFSISDNKFNEMVVKGEIDPARRMTVDEMGNQVSLAEFKDNFNQQLGEVWTVDNGFKKKVKPPLIRILMKHNMGMSDEVFLGVTVFKDVAVKTVSSYQMNKGIWSIFNTLKDEMAQSRIEQELRNMPPQAQQKPQQEAPKQSYEQVEVEDVDEQMRRMTETNARAMGQMPEEEFDNAEVLDNGTNRFHINVEENPLREKKKKRDLTKNVKVKSTFVKGGAK
jgi:hypothetical protein